MADTKQVKKRPRQVDNKRLSNNVMAGLEDIISVSSDMKQKIVPIAERARKYHDTELMYALLILSNGFQRINDLAKNARQGNYL